MAATRSENNVQNLGVPDHREVYRFIRQLFTQAQLAAEVAPVTLIYLERLLTYAEADFTPSNWKRLTLGAIMLASKVWDDQAVWNVDFCMIIEADVEDLNTLERSFLELLQFNVNVPGSVYAKVNKNIHSCLIFFEERITLRAKDKKNCDYRFYESLFRTSRTFKSRDSVFDLHKLFFIYCVKF